MRAAANKLLITRSRSRMNSSINRPPSSSRRRRSQLENITISRTSTTSSRQRGAASPRRNTRRAITLKTSHLRRRSRSKRSRPRTRRSHRRPSHNTKPRRRSNSRRTNSRDRHRGNITRSPTQIRDNSLQIRPFLLVNTILQYRQFERIITKFLYRTSSNVTRQHIAKHYHYQKRIYLRHERAFRGPELTHDSTETSSTTTHATKSFTSAPTSGIAHRVVTMSPNLHQTAEHAPLSPVDTAYY